MQNIARSIPLGNHELVLVDQAASFDTWISKKTRGLRFLFNKSVKEINSKRDRKCQLRIFNFLLLRVILFYLFITLFIDGGFQMYKLKC